MNVDPGPWLRGEVKLAILLVYALLVAGTLAVRAMAKRTSEDQYRELRQRAKTWWLMVTLFLGCLAWSRETALGFFVLVSYLALKEYLSLIPTRRADRRVLFWAYLAILLQYFWVLQGWYGMFIIFIPVYMFMLLPLRMVTIGETEGFLRSIGVLQWGLMLTVFTLSHAAYLLTLRLPDAPEVAWGPGLVLFLVALTQMNDCWQFVWGKTLGKNRIVPTVSPNKTWEGFLGGLATTTVLAGIAGPWLTPMGFLPSLGAGAIFAVGGFLGDVNLSAMKRDLGVKDAGSMLPGHGGILDRVNSLTFASMWFFHYLYWLLPWTP